MDASAKKRVLVASMALVMVISAVAIFFNSPQNSNTARTDQSTSYLNELASSGNEPTYQSATPVTNAVSDVIQTYLVTFTSIGYLQGLSWSITVDGTNTVSTTQSTITFQLANGTHSFAVENHPNYLADPSNGVVMVYGSSVTQYITFSLVDYALTFVASGLPAGSTWSVNLSGTIETTSTDSIQFNVGNGTYSYTITGPANYAANPSTGSAVVYGENQVINVSFVATLHKVTFNFSGDISGTSWEINFDNNLYTVSGSSLSVIKGNGLYNYSISTASEYLATPTSGSILVLDSDSSLNVTIQVKTYTVSFEHVGMSVGTPWEITLGGVTHNSTSSIITFEVPAGNYTYEVNGASGYSTNASTGYVNVASQDQQVSINFVKNTDFGNLTLMLVIGAVVGIAAGAGIGLYIIRKK